MGALNASGTYCGFILNSSSRTGVGGVNTATFRNDAGNLRISAAGNNPFVFWNASTGRVGINETNPSSTLHVLEIITASYFIGALSGTADTATKSYRSNPYVNEWHDSTDGQNRFILIIMIEFILVVKTDLNGRVLEMVISWV